MIDQLREALNAERPHEGPTAGMTNRGQESTEQPAAFGMDELQAACGRARSKALQEGHRLGYQAADAMAQVRIAKAGMEGETLGALGGLRHAIATLEDRLPPRDDWKAAAVAQRKLIDDLVEEFSALSKQLDREGVHGERETTITQLVGRR